jgi:hypothetical protein
LIFRSVPALSLRNSRRNVITLFSGDPQGRGFQSYSLKNSPLGRAAEIGE